MRGATSASKRNSSVHPVCLRLDSLASIPQMTDSMSLKDAVKRVDEIAQVTRFIVSPSRPDRTSCLGARKCEKAKGEDHHRTSKVVRQSPYRPNCIPTRGCREGRISCTKKYSGIRNLEGKIQQPRCGAQGSQAITGYLSQAKKCEYFVIFEGEDCSSLSCKHHSDYARRWF